jgi:hypothetical protein
VPRDDQTSRLFEQLAAKVHRDHPSVSRDPTSGPLPFFGGPRREPDGGKPRLTPGMPLRVRRKRVGFNCFGYVKGNPLKYVDPDGKYWLLATSFDWETGRRVKIPYYGGHPGDPTPAELAAAQAEGYEIVHDNTVVDIQDNSNEYWWQFSGMRIRLEASGLPSVIGRTPREDRKPDPVVDLRNNPNFSDSVDVIAGEGQVDLGPKPKFDTPEFWQRVYEGWLARTGDEAGYIDDPYDSNSYTRQFLGDRFAGTIKRVPASKVTPQDLRDILYSKIADVELVATTIAGGVAGGTAAEGTGAARIRGVEAPGLPVRNPKLNLLDARPGVPIAPYSAEALSQIPEALRARGALRELAAKVHGMLLSRPNGLRAFRSRTVSIAQVRLADGTRQIWASGSSGRLEGYQQRALEAFGITIVRGGSHAEMNIITKLPKGAVVERWGISWAQSQKAAACPELCSPQVRIYGGGVIEQ